MFRPMVRKKQQITEEECIEILKQEPRGVLAVLGDEAALEDLARRAYACGRRCHEREDIRAMLTEDFKTLLNEREDV